MATHSSILSWEIPWTEGSGGLQSMGSQTVGHDLVTKQHGDEKLVWMMYTESAMPLQSSRKFTQICGLQVEMCPQMHCHPSQDRRPHPSALALLQLQLVLGLFAFHLTRANLFISPGALNSCLWRLISFLPLVRKGREDQVHGSHLPIPFLENAYLIFFLYSPFILFLQRCGD